MGEKIVAVMVIEIFVFHDVQVYEERRTCPRHIPNV
jgi:hypothetical protein